MTTAGQMYEVVVFGEILAKDGDFEAIFNRFTLHSESCERIHYREVSFESISAPAQRQEDTPEPVLLRCRQDLLAKSKWTLYTYLKAEPVRLSPHTTIRPAVNCQVLAGDALAFASALGYRQKADIYKRGYLFRRGIISSLLYQYDKQDAQGKPEPDTEASWNVEVKSYPVRNSQETPLSHSIEAVLEVKGFMKGLLDLERRET